MDGIAHSENLVGDGLPYHLDSDLEQAVAETAQDESVCTPEHALRRRLRVGSAAIIPYALDRNEVGLKEALGFERSGAYGAQMAQCL